MENSLSVGMILFGDIFLLVFFNVFYYLMYSAVPAARTALENSFALGNIIAIVVTVLVAGLAADLLLGEAIVPALSFVSLSMLFFKIDFAGASGGFMGFSQLGLGLLQNLFDAFAVPGSSPTEYYFWGWIICSLIGFTALVCTILMVFGGEG